MPPLMGMRAPIFAIFSSGTLGQFAASSSFGNLDRHSTGQVSDYKQDYVWPDRSSGDKGGGTRKK